ncbi:MAG: EAL domain-containing protein [Acidobacteria bacterium]|nr:EAL domain-containing protein [Acidobacteriota bacterium]
MYERTLKSWNLDNDLQNALQRGEFLVHYQPLVSLSTGRISGAEALVRWKRSNGEIVSPAEFIPRAEESNLILDIGEWVLRTACFQARQWSQPEMPLLTMSVNLSGRQLSRVDFLDIVLRTLADTGLSPSQLELELTETILMDSSRAAKAALDGLSREGIKLSIDDFGTGYSSLGYLRKFAFDTLKLDQTFVTDVHSDRNAAALTRGLIALAHDLNLRVTAEGVEETEQLRFLAAHGCDTVQGYLACRPVCAEEFTKLLFRQTALLPSFVPASLLEARGSERSPHRPSSEPRPAPGERARLTLVS